MNPDTGELYTPEMMKQLEAELQEGDLENLREKVVGISEEEYKELATKTAEERIAWAKQNEGKLQTYAEGEKEAFFDTQGIKTEHGKDRKKSKTKPMTQRQKNRRDRAERKKAKNG